MFSTRLQPYNKIITQLHLGLILLPALRFFNVAFSIISDDIFNEHKVEQFDQE